MGYTKFEFQGKEFHIDRLLAVQLNSIAYNLKKDNDFVIIVSGSRMVRVGKSTMGMQIGAYLSMCLKKMGLNDDAFNIGNVYFEGEKLINESQNKRRSVILYDEARETLSASKRNAFQQRFLDFMNECGQLNNIYILCIADFFTLKEEIAIGRTELLINVFRQYAPHKIDLFKENNPVDVVEFKKGFFKFYNRESKNLMYDIFRTTNRKNYNSIRPSFPMGNFLDGYTLDEEAYRDMKLGALKKYIEVKEKPKITGAQFTSIKKVLQSIAPKLSPLEIEEIGIDKRTWNKWTKNAEIEKETLEEV